MWNFFQSLVTNNEFGEEPENAPELVVNGALSKSTDAQQSVVDEESGRSYQFIEPATGSTSSTSLTPSSSSTKLRKNDDDDDDGDGDHKDPLYNGFSVANQSASRVPISGASESDDDSDDDSDENQTGAYYEESDEEIDSEFLTGCYEYFEISDRVYGVRRVASQRIDILAHESTPLVAFCYAVAHHSKVVMNDILYAKPAVVNPEVAIDVRNETSPLGLAGWFVRNVLNDQPVFAFDDFSDGPKKRIVDLCNEIPVVENSALKASESDGPTGIALLVNGSDFVERATLAYEISHGISPENAVDVLQHTFGYKHLRRFDRVGQTAPVIPSAEDAPATRVALYPTSPVTSTNGRWYVVTAAHYALFKSNELLVQRSGASLARLARLLDDGRPIFTSDAPICTPQQQRLAFTRFLESEVVTKERERDNARFKLFGTLRAKCGQLAGMRERIAQIKVQKSMLSISDTDESTLKFLVESLGEVADVVNQLDEDQKSAYTH